MPFFLSLYSRVTHPDYINTRLEDHVWYVGDMSRDEANARLNFYPSGAFLVRCGRLGYALSLKTISDVKHMKIDSSDSGAEDDNVPRNRNTFYFSENRRFFSIVELVITKQGLFFCMDYSYFIKHGVLQCQT